jgi:hypothetical protein
MGCKKVSTHSRYAFVISTIWHLFPSDAQDQEEVFGLLRTKWKMEEGLWEVSDVFKKTS